MSAAANHTVASQHRLKDMWTIYAAGVCWDAPGERLCWREVSAMKCNIKIMERFKVLTERCELTLNVWFKDSKKLLTNIQEVASCSPLQSKVTKWVSHMLLALLPNTDFSLFIVICQWVPYACLHLLSWERVLRKHLPADLLVRTPLYKLISAGLFWLRLTAEGCGSSCET